MDWSRDLEEHPLKIEGAWIRICCKLWWSETRGEITKSPVQWGRLLGVSKAEAMGILGYIKTEKIGDVTFRNPKVTVACRRMVRDESARKANRDKASRWRDRQKENDNPKSNPKVTPPSSSSSSSLRNNPPLIPPRGEFKNVKISDSEFQKLEEKFGSDGTNLRIENLSQYIASKGKKYNSHYATILSWDRKENKENGIKKSDPGYVDSFLSFVPETAD